ncbi:MAG: cytidine deaminase [Candidatus Sungbacteria bacterium]|nr:cytidine deaminase [Candidatus Sungbacteria bacterium]
MKYINYQELSELQKKALDEAANVLENSYAPYSKFHVGAALISADGTIITGTNFENAAYSLTVCAERAAVVRANAMGIKKIRSIAVIARGDTFDTVEVTGPCGDCRQVLYETSQISNCDTEVILSTTKKDKIIVTSIKELLPLGLGPDDIGMDISRYRQ